MICRNCRKLRRLKGCFLPASVKRNVFAGEVVSLFMLPEYCLMRFQIAGSPRPFDFELKFPAYIKECLGLSAGKKTSVALWEPSIIVFRGL